MNYQDILKKYQLISLIDADLAVTDLSEAELSGADLSGAKLFKSNLCRANFYRAKLFGADLSEVNLSGANLSGANLSKADLSHANLSGANLSGANLAGADLSNAITDKPIVLLSLNKHPLQFNFNITELKIGCEIHSFKYWIDHIEEIGIKNNYSKQDIYNYLKHIKAIIRNYND